MDDLDIVIDTVLIKKPDLNIYRSLQCYLLSVCIQNADIQHLNITKGSCLAIDHGRRLLYIIIIFSIFFCKLCYQKLRSFRYSRLFAICDSYLICAAVCSEVCGLNRLRPDNSQNS